MIMLLLRYVKGIVYSEPPTRVVGGSEYTMPLTYLHRK